MNIEAHLPGGFRSTLRDWASEQTSFPHQTCEHALAHRISDKAEAAKAAYRRGDQVEKRRKLIIKIIRNVVGQIRLVCPFPHNRMEDMAKSIELIAPMTLGNMRENGVRCLAVYCINCPHTAVLDVSDLPDSIPVPAFSSRMVGTRCESIGADARPHWKSQNLE